MSEINYNAPAFPTTEAHGFNNGEPGMTLRDYFAAKALTGIISNYQGSLGNSYPVETLNLSRAAYAVADAMLKARENNNV